MNEATKTFVDEINTTIHDATHLGGRKSQAALRELRDMVRDRRISDITSAVDPDDVDLTDEQWRKITKKVGILASGPAEQW